MKNALDVAALLLAAALAVAVAADVPAPGQGSREALAVWRPLRATDSAGGHHIIAAPSLWKTHRTLVIVTLAALATETGLILWLISERRRRQRAKRMLRRLSSHLIRSQEHDLKRISRELHDHLNQQVALAAIELDTIANAPDPNPQRVRAVADELRVLGLDMHTLSHGLRPPEIEYMGLLPAVRALAEKIAARSSIAVEVVDEGWPANAPLDAAIVLYRVAQEAIHNAVRHSEAATVRLTLSGTPQVLSLTVSDDGRGFDPNAALNSPRLGLTGMRERLWLLGGSLVITSEPSRGTRLEAKIPLPIAQPNSALGVADGDT